VKPLTNDWSRVKRGNVERTGAREEREKMGLAGLLTGERERPKEKRVTSNSRDPHVANLLQEKEAGSNRGRGGGANPQKRSAKGGDEGKGQSLYRRRILKH